MTFGHSILMHFCYRSRQPGHTEQNLRGSDSWQLAIQVQKKGEDNIWLNNSE